MVPIVLISACGTSADSSQPIVFDPCQPVVLVPDSDATMEQLGGVAVAIELWQRAAGTHLSTDEGAAAPRLPVHFQSAALAFRGLYDPTLGRVFINSSLTDEHQLAVTVTHEVGHAFGLKHIDPQVRASLMNPGNLTVEPTTEDIATLASLWGRCSN